MHKQQGWQAKPIQNTWRELTRSELKLESVHQESPRSDIFRKRATKPLLKQKHRQKHLTWVKEKKNWTVAAQWSKVLFSDESTFWHLIWRGEWRGTEFMLLEVQCGSFYSQWWFGAAMSSAGVGPLCFLKSTVNAAIYQDILEHSRLPSADKLYGDADFIFQQELAPAHTAKRYQKLVQWPWCYCAWLVSKLAWPEPHRESMYCPRRRWESTRSNMQMDPEERYQRNWALLHLSSATGWSPPWHAELMPGIACNQRRSSNQVLSA